MKPIIILAAALMVFCSCEPGSNPSAVQTTSPSDLIDDSIVQLILTHYNVDKSDSSWKVISDSAQLLVEYQDPAFGEDLEGMQQFSIPLKKSSYLIGDLTGDAKDEIVHYHEELGMTGPLVQEILVFTGEPGSYRLLTANAAYMMSQCPEEGSFTPIKIENGKLLGSSACFREEDARCCPSLHYSIVLEWKDGAFETVEMNEIMNP